MGLKNINSTGYAALLGVSEATVKRCMATLKKRESSLGEEATFGEGGRWCKAIESKNLQILQWCFDGLG